MKKKIFIFLISLTLILSCGKKGDPSYKESKIQVLDTNLIVVL